MKLTRPGYALGLLALCVVALSLFATSSNAQTVTVGDLQIDPTDFSPQQDTQTRIATCLECHGPNAGGDADFGPDVHFGTPALRGMQSDYLKQSLIAYKTGLRANREMRAIASMLNDETVDFMARTFAAYPAPETKTAEELAAFAKKDATFRKGQAIATNGVPEKEVPACMTCHGETGEGNPDLGPRLAGQNRLYIQQQFKEFVKTSSWIQEELFHFKE